MENGRSHEREKSRTVHRRNKVQLLDTSESLLDKPEDPKPSPGHLYFNSNTLYS